MPHDTNCDSLIDKKVARTDRLVDDPIVVDGRFYDVGRNPDPVGTLPKTDYGDFRFRVSHIKFDWKDNVGTGPAGQPIPTFDEGFNLRRDNTAGDLGKYEHRIDQKSRGEWIYQFYTPDGAHAGRNEPALYAAGKKGVNLKVRVECANPVNYAWVGALEDLKHNRDGTLAQTRTWRDVGKVMVRFYEKIPGKLWVSGTPTNEYIEMPLEGATTDSINKSTCVWQWYVDQVMPGGTGGTEIKATNLIKPDAGKPASAEWKGWAINRSGTELVSVTIPDPTGGPDITVEFEIPWGHLFYTVLGKSSLPWHKSEFHFPWATALNFTIDDAKTKGLQTRDDAAMRIATFCFNEYGLQFDHLYGFSHFGPKVKALILADAWDFELGAFIAHRVTEVNSFDQSMAVATMIDLVAGSDAQVVFMNPFGYVNRMNFVGSQDDVQGDAGCNNPQFQDSKYVLQRVVPEDDTYWRTEVNGQVTQRKRSLFVYYAWAEDEALGRIYDATLGPLNTSAPGVIDPGTTPGVYDSRIVFGNANVVDTSHTGTTEWEDDEFTAPKVADSNPGSGDIALPTGEAELDADNHPDPKNGYVGMGMGDPGSCTFKVISLK